MTVYFNEIDPYPAKWLGNLFPDAFVDHRSIKDVRVADTDEYLRCHFFAGIGGWELALQLAGWPADREVWTGSCPCQPFSQAGKRKGKEDERHLWPDFLRLIDERRPSTIFGEQVASPDGRQWLAGVRSDMEALGYAVGSADLCAASVGAPHNRPRLYWVAVALGDGNRAGSQGWLTVEHAHTEPIGASGVVGVVSDMHGCRCDRSRLHVCEWESRQAGAVSAGSSEAGSICNTKVMRDGALDRDSLSSPQSQIETRGSDLSLGWLQWGNTAIICADGKARRVEPSIQPLAHGISNRVGRIRAYGNAIVPQVAALFIRAFLETET